MESNLQNRWLFAAICVTLCPLGSAEEGSTIDPAIIEKLVQSKLELTPGSPAYEAWTTPTDHYFDVFMFNWTNSEIFKISMYGNKSIPTDKLHFEEVGPYRFRLHQEYTNVAWNHTDHTLGYNVIKKWVFEKTGSLSLDDNITTTDFLANLAVNLGRFNQTDSDKAIGAVYLYYSGHDVSLTRTVRQLLFEGYTDSILELAHSAPEEAEQMGLYDKFAWFYNQNNTVNTKDFMEVTTGEQGALPGQIVRWKHEDYNKHYDRSCFKISGSTGDFFPRDLTEESQLKVFLPELCRTVSMPYESSGEQNGLQYHKYGIAASSFDKAQNTNCYCNGTCEWSGVMNTTACRLGSPVFITLPHFLHGDPHLTDHVDGLHPDPKKHSFYYKVEPRTGIPLEVVSRYQINAYVEKDNNLYAFMPPKLLLPVLWVQEIKTTDQAALERLVSNPNEIEP